MKFQKYGRYEFKDTPRKRATFFQKQRRERAAHPLFVEMIAEEQAARHGIDEVKQQRAEAFAKGEQEDRDHRAKRWREARAKIAAYAEPTRTKIRELWNDAPYPADPTYLSGMLHDIERAHSPGQAAALASNPARNPNRKSACFSEQPRQSQERGR